MDDVQLVTRLRAGDVSALDTLIERHAPRAYRRAYAITRNHGDAEEVVQDVFLNVFRKITTFEGRAADYGLSGPIRSVPIRGHNAWRAEASIAQPADIRRGLRVAPPTLRHRPPVQKSL